MPLNPISLRPFVILASLAIVLYLLFWLQPVLIPVALAILLTFMLSPVVAVLQRHGLPRVSAVIVVTTIALSLIGGIGWMVGRQLNALLDSFPQYEHNLRQKISAFKSGEAGFLTKLQEAVKRTTREIEKEQATATPAGKTEPDEKAAVPVRVVSEGGPGRLGDLWEALSPVLGQLAAVALAVVLLIFMLIRREDLRDRLIGLVGRGRLTVTTKALDEAGERISRYLLMQLIINGSYGVAVGIGLYFIGVPYAALWGFFAAVFRYVPYIGPWIAALLPVVVSLLVSASWTPPLLVIGLFLALELFSNMVMEPWLYGRRIGVSETAMLVMIAFWTWLWGPIGLVLATPLTVCLALLGKYVPLLKFFDTLLSDRPALEIHIGYYQRLLARDQDEASDIAQEYVKQNSLQQACDRLLIPALIYARRDLERDELDEQDHRFVLQATRDILEELAALQENTARPAAKEATQIGASPEPTANPTAVKVAVLACPARDEADEVGSLMLKELLDSPRCEITLTSSALLASELLALVAEQVAEHRPPLLLCIASLPPGGVAHTRLLCLRLRARYPDLKIVVGRWGMEGNADKTRDQLLSAGVHFFSTSLEETCNQIRTLASLSDRGEVSPAPDARASNQARVAQPA